MIGLVFYARRWRTLLDVSPAEHKYRLRLKRRVGLMSVDDWWRGKLRANR